MERDRTRFRQTGGNGRSCGSRARILLLRRDAPLLRARRSNSWECSGSATETATRRTGRHESGRRPSPLVYESRLERVSPCVEVTGQLVERAVICFRARPKYQVQRGECWENLPPRDFTQTSPQAVARNGRRPVTRHDHSQSGMTRVVRVPGNVHSGSSATAAYA
jgi:hypothetical protein